MVCERGTKCAFVLSYVVKYSGTIGGSCGLRVGRTLPLIWWLWNANTRENEASSVFLKHMNSLLWVELEGWCCHDHHCPYCVTCVWWSDYRLWSKCTALLDNDWVPVDDGGPPAKEACGMCTEQVAPDRNLLGKLDCDANQPFKMKYRRIWKIWKPGNQLTHKNISVQTTW